MTLDKHDLRDILTILLLCAIAMLILGASGQTWLN